MYDWFDGYCMEKPGVTKDFKAEWGWERYYVGDKLFAVHCMNDSGEEPYAISFKSDPEEALFWRKQFSAMAPGYYTDKRTWSTVWFKLEAVPEKDRTPDAVPGFPPDDVVRELLDRAYMLAFSKLTKKAQREIAGE